MCLRGYERDDKNRLVARIHQGGGVHQGIDILFSNFFGDRNEEWAVAAQH